MSDWYVCVSGGEPVGPVSLELLSLGIESGKIPPDAFVCGVGEGKWRRLTAVPELTAILPAAGAFQSTEAERRYAMRRKLGEGGMGEVHLSHDAWIARDVAMKVMRAEHAAHAEGRARFVREARVQGQLEHPGIVPVHDLGTRADGSIFFTMKRVKGQTLHTILARLRAGDADAVRAFTRRKLLQALDQICLAVAFAHSRGVVHRDLKPDNVMLGDFGEVYVLDWGIAKVLEDSWAGAPGRSVEPPPGGTQTGIIVGTPGYAAPEQVSGEVAATGPRSDVYSLGAILFEVLTLTPLHRGATTEALVASTVSPDVPRPSARAPDRNVPPELDALCLRALRVNPGERLETAMALHEALERYLDGERDQERRRELAREHVTRAEQLFATASTEGGDAEALRAQGMRELGAAIALEPTNQDAARALLQVLVAAPDELPHAAEAELTEVDLRDRADGARFGMMFYLATALPTPFLSMVEIRRPLVWGCMAFLLVTIVAYLGWMWRTGKASPTYMRWAVPLTFLLVGVQSAVFGPYVVAPGAAAATAAVFLVSLRASVVTSRLVLAAGLASVFIPAGLEYLGLIEPTYSVRDGAIVIAPGMLSFHPSAAIWLLAFSSALTIAATVIGVGRAVRVLKRAERRNFAQAWRLRQLLPATKA